MRQPVLGVSCMFQEKMLEEMAGEDAGGDGLNEHPDFWLLTSSIPNSPLGCWSLVSTVKGHGQDRKL